MRIPKKFADRVATHLKGYQAITTGHRMRDVSEADTVTVIKDILADIFGYEKYLELTSEQQIRGTFCDLAVKIDGKIKFLIEVKAAAIDLNESHLRQAINYGANQGIEWVVLTNSIDWRLFRIKFGQPIDHEEVASFRLDALNAKKEEDLAKLFLLSREGLATDAVSEFHSQIQILNRFTLAQLMLSEPLLKTLRKEMKRLFPDVMVDVQQISDIITNDILKREVLEGDKVKEAQARLKKTEAKYAKSKAQAAAPQQEAPAPSSATTTLAA